MCELPVSPPYPVFATVCVRPTRWVCGCVWVGVCACGCHCAKQEIIMPGLNTARALRNASVK